MIEIQNNIVFSEYDYCSRGLHYFNEGDTGYKIQNFNESKNLLRGTYNICVECLFKLNKNSYLTTSYNNNCINCSSNNYITYQITSDASYSSNFTRDKLYLCYDCYQILLNKIKIVRLKDILL